MFATALLQYNTAFWAHKNNITLHNARFRIYAKKLVTPTQWEKDFLQRQISTMDWVPAGSISWQNGKCEVVRLFAF